jgi:hypothetical protein
VNHNSNKFTIPGRLTLVNILDIILLNPSFKV